MSVSAFSIASAVVFFNVGLAVIVILRHNLLFFMKHSTRYLCLLLLFTTARVLLPLDTPRAYLINSERVYPWVLGLLGMRLSTGRLTLGGGLLICWVLGGIVSLAHDIWQCAAELREIKTFTLLEVEQVARVSKEGFAKKAKIVVSPDVTVPKATGIFRPYVYLPPLHVTDDELRLILKHEICHIREGDIVIKIFYTVLKDIFWWNPLMAFFQSEVDDLLELRCDRVVTKNMDPKEKAAYLSTILTVINQSKQVKKKDFFVKGAMGFVRYQPCDMAKHRFLVIMEKARRWEPLRQAGMFSMVTALFVASFFVIVQPRYHPSEEDLHGEVEVTRDNAYIVRSEGTLALYVDGEFFCYIPDDELDVWPHSILEIKEEHE